MNIEHQWIDIRGLRIHYLRTGDRGTAVVLLHGGGVDSAALSWELLIPQLAGDHRVFAPDFPGYGESDKPKAGYSTEYYIRFLESFMDAAGLERASLVGISMGGAVALGFTLQHPERVEKLALVDSYGLQNRAPMATLSYLFVHLPLVNELTWMALRSPGMARASLKGLLHNPASVTQELVDRVLAETKKPGAGLAWRTFQKDEVGPSGPRTVYMDRLGEITAPTLIVQGSQDTLVPITFARQAHERIPGSQLQVIDEAGHWPQRDRPEEFNRLVVEFLKQGTETETKDLRDGL